MRRWEAACESGSFDSIEAFALYIQQLGTSYTLRMLQEFGEALHTHVQNFDVEQIKASLDQYPSLLQKLTQLASSESID